MISASLAALKLISPRVWLGIAIAAAIAAAVAGGLYLVDARAEKRGRAAVHAMWNAEKVAQQQAALKAQAAARAEEQRRVAAVQEIAHETQRIAARNRADALSADHAAPGLRDAFAAAIAAGRCPAGDPVAAGGSEAAEAARVVFTELFGGAEAVLRQLAAAADGAHAAGDACERAFDALTGASPGGPAAE